MSTRQRGIALITAILVVALASIAAAAILTSANLAIHRTATLTQTEQAWWVADGVESWVKAILQKDLQDSKVDALSEDWAKPVDYLPIEQGSVRGKVVDLQGRFNLNNLGVKEPQKYMQQFQRLMGSIEGVDAFAAQGVAQAIHDWIDADQEPLFPNGAEDTIYLGLAIPYHAANRPMTSVSELLAVQGVTPELYRALHDYVSTLPEVTPVNVNTAPEPVLRSLSKQPDEAKLAAFIKSREDKPVEDIQKLLQEGSLGPDLDPGLVTVASRYFMIQGEVFVGSSRVALYSLVYRPEQGVPVVLGHSAGTE